VTINRFRTRIACVSFLMLLAVVLLIGLVSTSGAQVLPRRGEVRRASRPVRGRYLVLLRDTRDLDATVLALQGVGGGRLRHIYRNGARGFAIETSEAGARALAMDPDVASVEEDGVVHVAGAQSLTASDSWGLDRIDQRLSTVGDVSSYDGIYRYAADGTGVHVYVVDTGIRTTHVEFAGRATAAHDVIGDGNGDGDCYGHGTHVAGTVGGGRFGVAKNVNLYSVRVLGCDGYGSYSGVAEGIDWITGNHVKPAVISMSIGGGASETVDAAIRAAIAAGITFVGAAGNDNEDSCLHLMGGVPEALVIGASGSTDVRESYSNYGACVDMFAPGGSITSAYAGDDSSSATMSGTSMATPHVAGAAALYLQGKPGASPAQVAAAITRNATRGVVRDAGTGSPNRLLFTAAFGDTAAPAITLTGPLQGAAVRGRATVTASAQDDVEIDKVVFSAGNTQLGSDSIAPYSIEWNTAALPDGPYSIVAIAYDAAGNSASARVSVTVRNQRDDTPPRVSVAALRGTLLQHGGALVPVSFSGTASDNLSTIRFVSFTVRDEYGRVQPSGKAVVTNGRFSLVAKLEASRRGGDADGRQYVLTVEAVDLEGNHSSATARVVVPHDHRAAQR
jgi:Subtilase family/Bacterial Ig domain/Peptidase inhibitor I9